MKISKGADEYMNAVITAKSDIAVAIANYYMVRDRKQVINGGMMTQAIKTVESIQSSDKTGELT